MERIISLMMNDIGSLSCAEIIDNPDLIPSLKTSVNNMRTYESGTSCNKYFHTCIVGAIKNFQYTIDDEEKQKWVFRTQTV